MIHQLPRGDCSQMRFSRFSSYPISRTSVPSSMADQLRSKITKENPTGKCFDAFGNSFNSIRENRTILSSPDVLGQLDQEGMVSHRSPSLLL